MADMDWLKPIEERCAVVESLPGSYTVADMLVADCRKLIAAVRAAERETDRIADLAQNDQLGEAWRIAMELGIRLRSGEVEGA